MGFVIDIYNALLYQPLFNALIIVYNYLPGHDFGIAVIALTVAIRLATLPLGNKAVKSQKALADLQPKLDEIKIKYKNNLEKQSKATMELYKQEKINPFSGCLPLLVQIPILIALYQLFQKGLLSSEMGQLYGFVAAPSQINSMLLGIVDLSKPNLILAALAGILQYVQSKMVMPQSKKSQADGAGKMTDMIQKQTLYMLPAFTVFILWNLPSALGLYWITTSLFSIGQQYLIFNSKKLELQKKQDK